MGTGHEEEPSRKPALRGHDGQQLAYPHHTAGTAGRNLQSGGTKPCESIIRCAGVYCGSRCRRHPAYAGSSTYPGTGEKNENLSGFDFRTVRSGAGGTTERDNPVLPTQSIWCGQAIWLLDYEELPGKLRHVRRKRHSLQPRKRTARRNLRDTQNYTGGSTYSPRISGQVISG